MRELRKGPSLRYTDALERALAQRLSSARPPEVLAVRPMRREPRLEDETIESESRQLPEFMKPWLTAMLYPAALPKRPPKMIHCRKGTWCMWAAVEDGDAERRYQWVPVSEAVAKALGAETGQTRKLNLADAESARQREVQTVAAVITEGRAKDAALDTLYRC